jgi:molybdate transport system substrate-binding protein
LKRSLALVTTWIFLAAGLCSGQEITVAAAADLQFAFQDVAARFQKEAGQGVKLVFGSSGNFFAQIQNGAPFDIFFSADVDYPRRLETAGLAEPGTRCSYATGKIVLWAPKESAVAALEQEGIYDRVADKFVLGENVSQAASFVVSGSADAGIVALSLALAPSMKEKGKYAEIPAAKYPAIEQAAVILKSSQHKGHCPAIPGFSEDASHPRSPARLWILGSRRPVRKPVEIVLPPGCRDWVMPGNDRALRLGRQGLRLPLCKTS